MEQKRIGTGFFNMFFQKSPKLSLFIAFFESITLGGGDYDC
jgi:hypothetical protein